MNMEVFPKNCIGINKPDTNDKPRGIVVEKADKSDLFEVIEFNRQVKDNIGTANMIEFKLYKKKFVNASFPCKIQFKIFIGMKLSMTNVTCPNKICISILNFL